MTWLKKIESLQPGDPCEFTWPARTEWRRGIVVKNGGSGYWHIMLDESYYDEVSKNQVTAGQMSQGSYIEHVRLPGQVEAWPRRNQ